MGAVLVTLAEWAMSSYADVYLQLHEIQFFNVPFDKDNRFATATKTFYFLLKTNWLLLKFRAIVGAK